MKAQGLPINFIVLIALGVIILVALILFFFSGFRTQGISTQSAINLCNVKCASEIQYAQSGGSYPHLSDFCSKSYFIDGKNKNCNESVTCKVNSTCILTCDSDNAKCQ